MPHIREEVIVMDTAGTIFKKPKNLTVSRPLALFLLFLFLVSVIATGLLVSHFTACDHLPESEKTTVIVYDKYSKIEVTTGIDKCGDNDINTEANQISVTTATSEIEEEEVKGEKENIAEDLRLPKTITPHYYDLKLISFIREENFTFHGDVTILINVSSSSSNITLHAEDLNIDHVSLYKNLPSNDQISIKQVSNDTKRQFLIIYLNEPVKAQEQYFINIKFRGILNDLLQGFYRSSYKVKNETR